MKRKTKGQAVVSDVGHPCVASKKSSNTDDKYIGGMVNREGLYLTWSMLSRRVTHKYSKYAIQKSEEECMTKYNGQVREASHIPTCFFVLFFFSWLLDFSLAARGSPTHLLKYFWNIIFRWPQNNYYFNKLLCIFLHITHVIKYSNWKIVVAQF
jgi:hypothetical protein